MVLTCKTLKPLLPKDALCRVWLKLAHWLWRRRFLNFVNVFCYFKIIFPWRRAWPFIWTKFNPFHPRMLCVKFGWKWPIGSGKDYFLIFSMDFCYLLIINPWKRTWPFIWKNRIPLIHPRIFCVMFGWNWLSDSGDEDF